MSKVSKRIYNGDAALKEFQSLIKTGFEYVEGSGRIQGNFLAFDMEEPKELLKQEQVVELEELEAPLEPTKEKTATIVPETEESASEEPTEAPKRTRRKRKDTN